MILIGKSVVHSIVVMDVTGTSEWLKWQLDRGHVFPFCIPGSGRNRFELGDGATPKWNQLQKSRVSLTKTYLNQ